LPVNTFSAIHSNVLNTANIDWSGLKCAAIALNSVQEAARQAAVNLPDIERRRFVERVNKRAYRERWLDKARAISKPNVAAAKPLSNFVQSGSDTLANTLASRLNASRLNLSSYVVDASDKSARSKGDHKLARSTREVATIMEKVWPNEKEQNSNTLVSVQILNER
jgi:hypothetical protein